MDQADYSYLRWPPVSPKGKAGRTLADPAATAPERVHAAFLLGKRRRQRSFWPLAMAATDADFWVRAAIVRAFARLGDFRGFPFLLHLLEDAEPLVRYETRLALKYLLSRGNIVHQHDLLAQYDEGSAHGLGPLHVTALPNDIALKVFNQRLLAGKGLDIKMKLGTRVFGLHDGKWTYLDRGPRDVAFTSEDRESGIVLEVTIRCENDAFRLHVDGVFPEDTVVDRAYLDLLMGAGVDGPSLLPSNGLRPGPTRQFVLGNELMMRRCSFNPSPKGIVFDAVGSLFFRNLFVNPLGKGRIVQALPVMSRSSLPAGRHQLFTARLIPAFSREHFEDLRRGVLNTNALGEEHDPIRWWRIGSAAQISVAGRSVLSSFGILADYIVEGEHHTSFMFPFQYAPVDERTATATFRVPQFNLEAVLRLGRPDAGTATLSLESLTTDAPRGQFKFGLLLDRGYRRWQAGADWMPFARPLRDASQWRESARGEIAGRRTIYFKGRWGSSLPILRATLTAPAAAKATYALKSTERFFDARVIEAQMPVEAAVGGEPVTVELRAEE